MEAQAIYALLAEKIGAGALGFDADAYNFEFELIKTDGDWLLIGAQWGRLGSELL